MRVEDSGNIATLLSLLGWQRMVGRIGAKGP